MMSETDPLLPSPQHGAKGEHLDPDLRYGCLGARPSGLQRLNTVKGFVTCLCLCSVSHTIVTIGLPSVILSTLELRFGLSSTQSSWIVSAFEVATIPALIAITLLGPK